MRSSDFHYSVDHLKGKGGEIKGLYVPLLKVWSLWEVDSILAV